MSTSHQTHLSSPPKFLKEDEQNQEFKDLISSLPKQIGWLSPHLCKYQGFWHDPRTLKGLLAFQKHFTPQTNDILLITFPKSGTTWLKALVYALVNRDKYPINKDHPLLNTNPHSLVPFLDASIYSESDSPDLTMYTSPRIFATHLPLVSLPQIVQDSPCKFVYLCRNAKDTFVSLWQFMNKFKLHEKEQRSIQEMFDMFYDGVNLYGPLWDHVKAYYDESLTRSDKIMFLTYEGMKEEPGLHLRRLAEFLGYRFTLDEERIGVVNNIVELCSFGRLSNLEVNKEGKLLSGVNNRVFFRRGEVGDWKNYLTQEMADRLDSISREKLCGCDFNI